MGAPEHPSLALLRQRCAEVPDALVRQLDGPVEPPYWTPSRVVVTGAGLAEGPARLLARLLVQQLAVAARFVPLSAFVAQQAPAADQLIICSQRLSPNARLAMARVHDYADALLLTSQPDEASDAEEQRALIGWRMAGGQVAALALEPERGMLLRVVGPAVSSLAAIQLVAQWAKQAGQTLDWPLSAIPDAARGGFAAGQRVTEQIAPQALLYGPLALITTGEYGELCHGLRWKLLEGLWRDVPPVFDALQFAHGPLQSLYHRAATLLALTQPGDDALMERLSQTLPPHHQLIALPSALPSPLSLFAHSAALDALLCHALSQTLRDLSRWPGQGQDGPLYGLAACPRCDATPCRCAA
jgi:hypothetical protein